MIEFSGHQGGIKHVNYFENDRKLVSCSDDKSVRIWDVSSGQVWVFVSYYIFSIMHSPAFISPRDAKRFDLKSHIGRL